LSLLKNLARPEKSAINIELAAFIDGGLFWNRERVRSVVGRFELNNNFIKRNLADAGLGIRMNTSLFESDIYMRLDFPFFIYDGYSSEVDLNNWVFSFQRSL